MSFVLEQRPYQQRIVAKAVDALDGGGLGSVLVESPTGSGKTVMGLGVARELAARHGWSVGWCAMRRNLLAQAAAENLRGGFGLDLKLISMFDKRPPQVDLLVIDEAQHDAALSMADLHGFIRPKRILGLSATPYRGDRFKLCFQKTIRDAGVHRLIQDGYLSPFEHFTIPNHSPEAVAEHYAREPDRWGRTLIFFHRLVDCRACERLLRDRGVVAETVTANSDRERQLADFAEGRTQALLAMLILAEGFDCPSLRTVFCRPSGRTCTVQMCGRVLRRFPGIATKQIVQCEQTRHPFGRTATPTRQFRWHDGGWRSVGANAQIDRVAERVQRVMAGIEVRLPPMLARPEARLGVRPRFERRGHGAVDREHDYTERM